MFFRKKNVFVAISHILFWHLGAMRWEEPRLRHKKESHRIEGESRFLVCPFPIFLENLE
jgi:hypothetical protein